MQTLAHDFTLLPLHDDNGTALVQNSVLLQSCISAAFVGEWMFRDRLVATGPNLFALRSGPISQGLMGKVEERLVGKKPSTLQICMQAIQGSWGTSLMTLVTEELVAQGVLEKAEDKR